MENNIHVNVNGEFTKQKHEDAAIQGNFISALQTNIIVNKILSEFQKEWYKNRKRNIKMSCYADDTVLLGQP